MRNLICTLEVQKVIFRPYKAVRKVKIAHLEAGRKVKCHGRIKNINIKFFHTKACIYLILLMYDDV